MSKPRQKALTASYLALIRNKKILLLRRQNTGYEDGNYSLVAGHVDEGESFAQCMVREAKEEVGIVLTEEDLEIAHIMHRYKLGAPDFARVDAYFAAQNWQGEIVNCEPHKCADLTWFALDALPENIIPCVRQAIECICENIFYSEFA